ncbi:MAG: S-adenosylmethionine:tRNA ribosyltransferase-isomerase, partial [Pseudomonadota bacterium]|nr:S-adenosylmethionine:tRNA ribosyltransferase-isomerase [Pseudomonadota bacterium]
MFTDEFNFALPAHLIAQHPPERRNASRLLCLSGGGRVDSMFANLPSLVRENDLLVLNDARVLKARLPGVKESGGKIEVLIERILDEHHALAQIRASHAPKPGSRLLLAGQIPVTVLGREREFFKLRFDSAENVSALLEQYGQLPLPPYITHAANAQDEERYQTVYACQP